MIVSVSTSNLKRTKWYEYLIRFCLGGLATALAALLAKKISPSFGGVFLAFPAVLASCSTLIEKHEREKKEEKGLCGIYRGRQAAGADAAGAAMGSVGLIVFAAFVWKLVPHHSSYVVIASATLIWAVVASFVWCLWKRNVLRHVKKLFRFRSQAT